MSERGRNSIHLRGRRGLTRCHKWDERCVTLAHTVADATCKACCAALVLTDAQHRALEVLADCSEPVCTGHETLPVSEGHQISGAVAHRLETMGLARSHAMVPFLGEVKGTDMAKYFGHWRTHYTITRKGLKAIGWVKIGDRVGDRVGDRDGDR